MTLNQLKPGQRATIRSITGRGAMAQRLMEMGLLEGSAVAITRRAIGGDPIEVEVMGYALSLRADEARQIEIEAVDDE